MLPRTSPGPFRSRELVYDAVERLTQADAETAGPGMTCGISEGEDHVNRDLRVRHDLGHYGGHGFVLGLVRSEAAAEMK